MKYISKSVIDTEKIGAAFGGAINKGCFIALTGDIGAGKTAFIRGLAQGLGSEETVSSPTFALMHEYQGGKLPLYHFDLYRIKGKDIFALGFDEIFYDTNVISAVEWSERLDEKILPPNRIDVNVSVISSNERCIVIKPQNVELDEIKL